MRLSPGKVETPPPSQPAPAPLALGSVGDRSKVTTLAPQHFGVQFTMDQEAHDLLRYAQDLLGHEVPTGDVAAVFKRALQALVPQLERRKFAATDRPRSGQRRSAADTRHVPAHVKRAVWERDQGRCTFVSETGNRCPARTGLQFDHVREFALGGEATVSGIRLRCRAHNQYEAERTFGVEFMRHKRVAAAAARAAAQASREAS
jgi:5-methylcytosine-specific restriction endonuclease McrA